MSYFKKNLIIFDQQYIIKFIKIREIDSDCEMINKCFDLIDLLYYSLFYDLR